MACVSDQLITDEDLVALAAHSRCPINTMPKGDAATFTSGTAEFR